jgi:hypothetical protein
LNAIQYDDGDKKGGVPRKSTRSLDSNDPMPLHSKLAVGTKVTAKWKMDTGEDRHYSGVITAVPAADDIDVVDGDDEQ